MSLESSHAAAEYTESEEEYESSYATEESDEEEDLPPLAKTEEELSAHSQSYWKMAARLLLKHVIEEAKHDRKVAEGKAAFSTARGPMTLVSNWARTSSSEVSSTAPTRP